MELGNMVFGNSRGSFPLKRSVGFEEEFERLNSLLEPSGYVDEFENDVFAIFPYWWGECGCGFDDYEFGEGHLNNCYQSELDAEKQKAGASFSGKWGFIGFPDEWSWDKKRKIEDEIYKKLTTKYGLPMQGCAVHCTCDYEQRYEAWIKTIGYADGHKPDCPLVKPNFHYKPTDFQIQWYKYPFRDSYTNQKITLKAFSTIIDACIDSLNGDANFKERIKHIRAQQYRWDKKRKQYEAEGWLCFKCMRGLPLKNKKVVCDMVERNWKEAGNISVLMIPDGTEIDWKKECEYFEAWPDGY